MKWLFIVCSYLITRSTVFGGPITEPDKYEDLKNDMADILHMIPKDKVTEIALNHLQKDDGFKAAITYMSGPEWVELVLSLRTKPEWKAFKEYLNTFGIPVDTLVHCMETFVQNVTFTPLQDKYARRNLSSFISDVEKVIPITEMLVRFNERMQTSSRMQLLLDQISKPESRKIFEDALKLDELKTMLKELKEMGLNFYDLFSLFYIFLGWGEFKL